MVEMPDDQANDDSDEHWFAFVRENEDVGFQIIRVNLGLEDHEATEEFPVASVVTVPYADGTNWPATPEEWDRLTEVEDQLLDRVGEGFLFAGVLSAGFSRDFVFFGKRVLQRDQLECDSVGEVLEINDPEWGVYEKKLLPTPTEIRRSHDDDVIRAVSEHGDQNERSRPVDHFLFFDRRDDAENCLTDLNKWTPEVNEIWEPEDDIEHFRLHVVFDQALEQPGFSEFTLRLEDLAEKHNGTYDGWETPLAKDDDDE